MEVKSEVGMKMWKIKKACAACRYHKKKCPPECPLASIFPSDTGKEDFKNVVKVFGASNFSKLMNRAHPDQHLAAENMIIEARYRMIDPVHGLPGIVETLAQKLGNLTSELASVNQQTQFYRRHNVVQQQDLRKFRSDEAKGASSSAPRTVPSPSLQETGSSLAQNDELSPYFSNAQVDPCRYNAINPVASLVSAYANPGDTAMAEIKYYNKDSDELKENSHQCKCSRGVVFKRSNDAEDLTKTSIHENKDIVQNYEDPMNISQENKSNVKCSKNVDEPTWDFIQENKANPKNCIYYNEWPTNFNNEGEEVTAKNSRHLIEEPEGSINSTAK